MPTTQGVAPGYIILGFQPIFYPNRRGYAMDKWERKDNSQFSIFNWQLTPSPFGHFPYDRGSFWVALKSSPVLGELPAGVRGLRIPCIARSRLKAWQVIARGNALGESFPRFLKPWKGGIASLFLLHQGQRTRMNFWIPHIPWITKIMYLCASIIGYINN